MSRVSSETEDLEPAADEREHEAALRLALDFAEIDARDGDYEEALRWLEVAERLNVTLPAEYVRAPRRLARRGRPLTRRPARRAGV